MKKVIVFSLILIICLFCKNNSFASMADFTDEEADKIQEIEKKEWEKEQENRINKSSNNYLKKLSIEGQNIMPDFDKQTINYELPSAIEDDSINIIAEADDEKAKIVGSGNVILNSGENNIKIDVTAENGTIRSYYIRIIKNVTNKQILRINTLNISASTSDNLTKDIAITPEFDKEIFEYNCNVSDDIKKINIEASANIENAIVEVTGNGNLKDGLNQIIVTVKNEDGDKIVYKINVFKSKEYNDKKIETEETQKNDNGMLYFIIIFILVLICVIIYFNKIKKGK